MHEIVNSQWNYIQKITMEILTLKYGKQTEREEKWKKRNQSWPMKDSDNMVKHEALSSGSW